MEGENYYKGFGDPLKSLKIAAERGYFSAQLIIGILYLIGKGVTKDETEAFQWFLKAAENGSVEAQVYVSHLYEAGRGIKRDHSEFLKWQLKADELNKHVSQEFIGLFCKGGIEVIEDVNDAFVQFLADSEN
jgi:TPR repeat protein